MPPSEGPVSSASQTDPNILSRDLCIELWARVIERLESREVFTTNLHFQIAIEEEYLDLTGTEAPLSTKLYIQRMVKAVNAMHPETYMAQGVQNGVAQAFDEGVRKLKWDVAKIQANGSRAILRFSRTDTVRDLLQDVNVELGQDDLLECVNHAVAAAVKRQENGAGARDPLDEAVRARAAREQAAAIHDQTAAAREQAALEHREQEKTAATEGEQATTGRLQSVDRAVADLINEVEVRQAIDKGEISPQEITQRVEGQQQRTRELEQQERDKIAQNLPKYVERGLITQEEADTIRKLHKIDEQVAKGQISEQEGNRVRNSYMDGDARRALESKIKDAVDGAVRYLQVFEAMQRISPEYDGALSFLIRYKQQVTAEETGVGSSAIMKTLSEDEETLQRILDIMDRKDHEVRLIAIRLPPYSYVMKRGLEKIGNMTIEEEFVDDLRNLTLYEMSERLNSPDKMVRVRPAADMNCFVSLIDHVIKRTTFRKEIRVLKLSLVLEEIYRNNPNSEEARRQAETYVNMRLRRLFPDLSLKESNEIKARGNEIINSVEVKVLGEKAAKKNVEKKPESKKQVYSASDLEELSENEREKGVTIGRVEMRVAGSAKRVPQKIMPDPEDPDRYVIASRDSATEELVPQIRRGMKRYVERNREGIWQIVTS
jgi:hypothetical protein